MAQLAAAELVQKLQLSRSAGKGAREGLWKRFAVGAGPSATPLPCVSLVHVGP